uniref:F-box domain-containing protein n=1 Tax=Moniliophthora roreri TaxID=221103 RepID=A0A0W0G074_MONRR
MAAEAPFEIWDNILKIANDSRTWCSAYQVSKLLHRVAVSSIYRKLVLDMPTKAVLCLKTLKANPFAASSVKHLTFIRYINLSIDEERGFEALKKQELSRRILERERLELI